MAREIKNRNETVYQCEFCDMGYADPAAAELCEEYCGTHESCSLEIARKAIYKPTVDIVPC